MIDEPAGIEYARALADSIRSQRPREKFSEGRYPFTYAYDLMRAFPEQFINGYASSIHGIPSRAAVAQILREQSGVTDWDDPVSYRMAAILADAYCEINNIEVPGR